MLNKKSDFIEIRRNTIGHTKYAVVIPTFKRPDTLGNTIKSVLSQNYWGDYTVMIIDNNPERNDSTEILMKQVKDSRVSYYKNETNVGMVNNWNQCIIAADSEWVVFVHDDDLLTENCLTNIDETLTDNPRVDAVLPNFTQKDNPYSKSESRNNRSKDNNVFKSLVRYFIHKNLPIAANLFCDNIYGPPTCGFALRKETVVEFGGYSDRCIAADWDFMASFSRNHAIAKSKKETGIYLWAVNTSLKDSTMEQIRKDRMLILKDVIAYSRISKFYYSILRKDFDRKFATRTIDCVKYSPVYTLLKNYYKLRV